MRPRARELLAKTGRHRPSSAARLSRPIHWDGFSYRSEVAPRWASMCPLSCKKWSFLIARDLCQAGFGASLGTGRSTGRRENAGPCPKGSRTGYRRVQFDRRSGSIDPHRRPPVGLGAHVRRMRATPDQRADAAKLVATPITIPPRRTLRWSLRRWSISLNIA